MKLKTVIHMDQQEEEILTTALGNIRNFLEEAGDENDVRMVVNHNAVKFFTRQDASDHADSISGLASKGVQFLICNNSISKMGIDTSDLLESCQVVPAGIVEIVRLQNEGFAYVKP